MGGTYKAPIPMGKSPYPRSDELARFEVLETLGEHLCLRYLLWEGAEKQQRKEIERRERESEQAQDELSFLSS